MIHNLGIFLMNCLLLSDWGSTGEHHRYLTNRKAKQQELAGNWATKEPAATAQPPTCLHVHVLPALHGLWRARSELLLGSFFGSRLLLSLLELLNMLVNGLPALRVTEKGLQFRNYFSKQTEVHCKSDSWGEAKRPASRLPEQQGPGDGNVTCTLPGDYKGVWQSTKATRKFDYEVEEIVQNLIQ